MIELHANIIGERFHLYLFASLLLVLPSASLAANEGRITDSNIEQRLQNVISIPMGARDEKISEMVKNALKGYEKQAVEYALNNIYCKNTEIDRACDRILVTFEEEALAEIKRRFATGKEITPLMRRVLWRWASSTKTYEVFCLAINENIDHVEPGEDVTRETIGAPARLCDLAYNLALSKIKGSGDYFGPKRKRGENVDPLVWHDAIAFRDGSIVIFKEWWEKNKNSLVWSESEQKYIVNQDTIFKTQLK